MLPQEVILGQVWGQGQEVDVRYIPVGDAVYSLLVRGEDQRADGVALLGPPCAEDTGDLGPEIQGFCPLSSMTCVLSLGVLFLVSLS